MLRDYETRNFKTAKETKDYLLEQKADDRWVECPVAKCSILTSDDIADFEMDASGQSVQECLEDTKIFLKFHDGCKQRDAIYPLRYTAIASLYNRAGVGGRSFYNNEEKVGTRLLSLEEKVDILNRCLNLYDENCKILIRDEKVSAVMSSQYAILPTFALEEALQKVMSEQYPLAGLKDGAVSHEFISLRWNLNDEEMEEDLKERLEEGGKNVQEVKAVLKFLTSDIGKANATVFPYFEIDGAAMRCGKPIKVEHKGKNTVKSFADLLPRMNAMFKNDVKRLENLAGMEIRYPADCFRAVAYHVGLPKKICMKLSESLEEKGSCTGLDIYYWLHVVVEEYQNQDDKKTDIVALLNKQEAAASSLYLNFHDFDAPFAWARGEDIYA